MPFQSKQNSEKYIYPGTELVTDEAQIRLLEVLSGEGDDPLRCILRSVKFDAIQEADALSYTWGLPPAANTIFVNNSLFQIRNNLFDALLHLRQPSSKVLLWIDAICINQSDIGERNHQVQQMGDIFKRARRVLIWLGVETENDRSAFSFLSEAYLRSPYNRRELMDDHRWAALNEMCEIDYWKRVWIVQEICLSPRAVICCGRQRIPWKYVSELRKARSHVWPQYQSSGERVFMRSLPARLDHQKEARLSGDCVLWTLLESFQDSLCQEFHDKIYGFMGLSTDCGGQGLTIDYTKSVEQLYQDVICFYYRKFGEGYSSYQTAPLMKLSEFLQTLLGNHPGANKWIQKGTLAQEQSSSQHQVEPILISPCNIMAIIDFPTSDHELAKEYGISDLIDYVHGKLPYSHIGYWRDLVESDSKNVSTIRSSHAYTSLSYTLPDFAQQPPRKIDHPAVFLALHIFDGLVTPDYKKPFVVGIAPGGSQIGDVVLNFVDSQVSLIMGRTQADISGPPQISSNFGRYILTGRGCVFSSHMPNSIPFKIHMSKDKKIEIVRSPFWKHQMPPGPRYFPRALAIDLFTLQLVSTPNTNSLSSGFNKPTLDLFPSESPETATKQDIYAHKLQKPVDDSELRRMQQDPEMKRYALGPGYTAISNPGAIGYVISSLQILYMLKPFRTAVLRSEDDANHPLLNELRKIFWKLHTSHLPVDPLGLTKTFGWGDNEINEAQDFSDFWRMFMKKVEDTTLGQESTFFMVGGIKTLYKPTGAARDEAFYDMQIDAVGNPRLETAVEDYFTPWSDSQSTLSLTELPTVLILNGKFWQLDNWVPVTYTGTFEYPSELDLKNYTERNVTDTLYQLHGLVVLEDVKPVSRYLLYLRPNIEDQWILFFKETVSYAQRSEVFEDNFRLDNEKTKNSPLRTPYVFVYILKSKLDEYLG